MTPPTQTAESKCSSARMLPWNARWLLIRILIAAASQLIVNRVDRGELVKAYEEATALVKRRPESA